MNVFHQEQTCLRTLPEQEAGRREGGCPENTFKQWGPCIGWHWTYIFENSLKIWLLQKAKLSLVDYVVFINVSCRQCASYNGERNGMMQPLFIQAFIYLRQDSKHFYERICLCNSQSYDG